MSECDLDSSGHDVAHPDTCEQAVEPNIFDVSNPENKSETKQVVDTENIMEITNIGDTENIPEQNKMETEPYKTIANTSQEMLNKAICDEVQQNLNICNTNQPGETENPNNDTQGLSDNKNDINEVIESAQIGNEQDKTQLTEHSAKEQKTDDDKIEQKPIIDRKTRFKEDTSTDKKATESMDDTNLSEDLKDLSVNNEVDEQKTTVDRKNRFKENVSDSNNEGYKDMELKTKALEKYEFFWKSHSPFSQWYEGEFTVEGMAFNSAEQYMMYSKAMLFDDEDIAYAVLRESDPREQKRFGRLVRNFNHELWEASCLAIVERGNKAKFSQDESLKRILLDTYPKTLVEASPYDVIWGIGLEADDPMAWNCDTWKGQNLLGKALTNVRDELKEEEKKGENQSEEYPNLTSKSCNTTENDITDTVDESILNQIPNSLVENTNLVHVDKIEELTTNPVDLPIDIPGTSSVESKANMEDITVKNLADNNETNKTTTEDSLTPESIISGADTSELNKTSIGDSQTSEINIPEVDNTDNSSPNFVDTSNVSEITQM
ncbi:uncharacterized protein LOC134696820 [Mytilus trossulus]|uniref:uncharacterized protein LOC134696820 n=1 Tax=Mytilus trossulus TaxID=6551 RepID=UPI003004718A